METIYRVIETVDGERYKWLHLLDYKLAQRLKMLCLYNMPDNDPQPKGE